MKPFYQDELVTIYNCRWEEILSSLGVKNILTDPPYGKGFSNNGQMWATSNVGTIAQHKPIVDDNKPFDPTPFLNYDLVVLWGANHYSHLLPQSAGWLIWDKRDGTNSNLLADCEMAWTNQEFPARLMSHRWMGMVRASEKFSKYHPTQKPVALMRWELEQIKKYIVGDVICDPFMGSGSMILAAREAGYKAIGIDVDPDYCQTVVDRLDSHKQMSLRL